MIVQNPLVPPAPTANGNAAAPVANAPAASQKDESEIDRPVTASERAERPNVEDRPTESPDGSIPERGSEVDLTI